MNKLPRFDLSQKPAYIKIAQEINLYRLFQKIDLYFDNCFIFESLGEKDRGSRYSIVGFDPVCIVSGQKNKLIIDKKSYWVKNPYFALRNIIPSQILSRNYAGGLVGYLNYDALNFFEPSVEVKTHELFRQFMFGVYTDGLVFDNITGELFYFYYTKERVNAVKKLLKSEITQQPLRVKFIKNSLNRKEYVKLAKKVKKQIIAGNTFQCVLSFKTEYEIYGNTLKIYERLRRTNPSPFMYYLKFGNIKLIGASPELLILLRDGEITTRPLAGTITRGKGDKEDQKLARNLLADSKEKAEHLMLIDLHRNDIGKVAQFGTVRVNDLMNVKKFSHIQHISSEITALIGKEKDMFSALAANFPMGTVSGVPKIETVKIINSLEKEPRGPYGGGVGHFGFNGNCTFTLSLRSLYICKNYAYTQTGSGIVYDSKAQKEYAEIKRKLEAVKKVMEI